MVDFNKIKDYFYSNKYTYFLVKDYVLGYNYLVDLGGANFLFGGVHYKTGKKSDNLFNYFYMNNAGFRQDVVYDNTNPKNSGILWKVNQSSKKYSHLSPALKQRIKEYKNEFKKGIDIQNRPKTEIELNEHRTVRIIGCYHNLEQAKQDYLELQEKIGANNKSCSPEEMVYILSSNELFPKDFKGKTIENETRRELI